MRTFATGIPSNFVNSLSLNKNISSRKYSDDFQLCNSTKSPRAATACDNLGPKEMGGGRTGSGGAADLPTKLLYYHSSLLYYNYLKY